MVRKVGRAQEIGSVYARYLVCRKGYLESTMHFLGFYQLPNKIIEFIERHQYYNVIRKKEARIMGVRESDLR